MKAIVDFLFEVGFLQKTPRTGFRFLGSGQESVAEHSFRVAAIGFVLSRIVPNVDTNKLVTLCLFHDLPEARTGDQNYVYKQYVHVEEQKAVLDLSADLPFREEINGIFDEYEKCVTVEAALAHDADQLDLLLTLKEQQDMGNTYAAGWIEHIMPRLRTKAAKELAKTILTTDHKDWWLDGHDEWWSQNDVKPSQDES